MPKTKNKIEVMLRHHRHLRGLTQKEAAALCRMARSHYQKFEYGLLIPRRENCWKLARLCGVSGQYLFNIANQIRHQKQEARR